ncbi:DeoR/GlpR family DNA-binding transcription regulator [Pseudomonas typographi]|uniref:DeoR/GlpR transcriptional regulator n=1 Tax=Pseudomonas typographi TaxID=2715964 RepID=A0ABR7Z6W3_9PSED|nr:DeoR/GlpR family DNA-binding transcription regulator [Pseudomonas typographi]MBD1554005.1 DeoR/GlpR transcriptional regulator [Pseudomonas typographi]MBD1589251.1 DeoR/GlpR transcriptional regulator [Pseudomonas typographi]MBD1601279.1 DeoR/GlpR transcriptional regulator [Pseudomonas typographi]
MILRQLRRQQVLSVHQLVDMFGCSHMTIRRDIAVLEKEGRAYSVAGGVRIASPVATEPSHQSKAVAEMPHKHAMAKRAATLLRPNMTLYLDAGTSTLALVPHIRALSGMTVVTNDFSIVMALADADEVDVIHTGGQLDHPNRSGVGELAAATLSRIATDIAFMSTASWDLQRGITTPAAAKVAVKRAAMDGASKRVLVATSSKYGTFGMYKIAPLGDFDLIVTDTGLAEGAAAGVAQLGIELAMVAPEPV